MSTTAGRDTSGPSILCKNFSAKNGCPAHPEPITYWVGENNSGRISKTDSSRHKMNITSSIALATHNGEKFIFAQLNSIANQTQLPDELIICDDLSTDNTLEIIKKFSKTVPFPVYLHTTQDRLGYIKNFEKAAALCTGDIVFFCDQDDIWDRQKIEIVISIFAREPEVGQVLHFCDFINEYDEDINRPDPLFGPDSININEMPNEIKENGTMVFINNRPFGWYGCMYAYRRIWNHATIPFFPTGGHDSWSLHIIGALAESRFLPAKLIHRRLHGANTTAKHLNPIFRFLKRQSELIKNITKGHSRSAFKKAILYRISKQPYIRYPNIPHTLEFSISLRGRFLKIRQSWFTI